MTHELFTKEIASDEGDQPVQRSKQKRQLAGKVVTFSIIALMVGGAGGFVAGLLIGKTTGSTAAAQAGSPGTADGNFGRRMGTFGTVSAVTTTSVTINDQRKGTTVSYDVTADTVITNAGATAAISDIKVGDTVMIRTADSASTATTKTATSIGINPSMNGGPGSNQTQSSSSSSSTN